MGIFEKALITQNPIDEFFNITKELLPGKGEVDQSFSVSWYIMITNHFIAILGDRRGIPVIYY